MKQRGALSTGSITAVAGTSMGLAITGLDAAAAAEMGGKMEWWQVR